MDYTDEQARERFESMVAPGSLPMRLTEALAIGRALLGLEAACNDWKDRALKAEARCKELEQERDAARRELKALREAVKAHMESLALECWCHGIQGSHDMDCEQASAEGRTLSALFALATGESDK